MGQSTQLRNETPVLIVGAGPVGLAVAGELSWRGTPSILIERTDGTITQPKMDLLGPRTMEYCRRWGLVDAVRSSRYNRSLPQDNVWIESFAGYEFGREPFPSPADERVPAQSPVKRERCPQDMFDPILRNWVEDMGVADVRYMTELVDFEMTDDAVIAQLKSQRTGVTSTVRASYLVGADGGGSFVRRRLGIPLAGRGALTYTTNVIFRCSNFWDLHDKSPGYRFILIGEEGTWATLVAIDGCDRYRFSIIGDQNERKLTEEDVRACIFRAMGRPFDFEIESIVPWVRRENVATRYRVGRSFLAGDSAHQNSPTGAFGMNTGMQDAVNLGWKLAAVVSGWGGRGLLSSYEVERRPVALRNVAAATENLTRMVSSRAGIPPLLFAPGAAGDAVRVEFGRAFTESMRREWYTLDIHLGYRYDNSPAVVPDGSDPPDDPPMVYTQTSRPGSRAPHVWLGPEQSTLDLFGRGFVLLRFDESVDIEPFRVAAAATGMPLEVADISSDDVRSSYEKRLVLVRPDGFVCWRADECPESAAEIVNTVIGRHLDSDVQDRVPHEQVRDFV